MPATKPKKSGSSSESSSEYSESPPKKKVVKKASASPKKTTKTTTKATTKTTKTTATTKKRDPSPKPKKRAASARASPKPKKRAQKASPEPKKRKASPPKKRSVTPKKRKAASPAKKRKAAPSPSPKKKSKAKAGSSSYRGRSSSRSPSRPKARKAARSPSPKKKENGEKASRPQARSFLGALKAVKANQKDMPKVEDSWTKAETVAKWDPNLACGHPDCELQVCSDKSVSEFFCCGKCSAAFYCKPIEKPQHGQRCEQKTPAKGARKAKPPAQDPKAEGGGWKKSTAGSKWGAYGSGGKSYGKAWSQWKETPVEESKEQTKGMRAWSDDDEPPVPRTNAAKKAKDEDKTKDDASQSWGYKSSWKDTAEGGNGWTSNWKKSNGGWSDWQSGGNWKSSWSGSGSWTGRGNQSKSYGWSGKTGEAAQGALETASLEEAEERRQKRLERFSSNAEASVLNKSEKVCHINWSSDAAEKTEGEKPEEAKKDSDDERAKQIRTGERARSEDHEDD